MLNLLTIMQHILLQRCALFRLFMVTFLGDEDIHTTDASIPIQVPISGPITRARARQLNHQVITLLSSCPSYLDHVDPCTLVLLRNQGEDRKGKGFEHAGFGLQKNTNL